MNDMEITKRHRETTTWIVVLAIAITCCAILFVVFANYLVAINKNLSSANARLSVMEANEGQLLAEIQSLHRMMLTNNPPVPKPNPPPPADKAAAPDKPATPAAPPAPPPVTQ